MSRTKTNTASREELAVPFLPGHAVGDELTMLADVVACRAPEGDGPFTRRVERWLETRFGAPRVLLTHSVGAALEIAMTLYDLGPGDEVLMPTFNYMPAANACLRRGAQPVLVDIESDSLNLDPACARRAVTPRTRALVTACYAGVAADHEALEAVARDHDLVLIEDAALGFAAALGDRALGTLGDVGAWCFHPRRHVTGGEAGALIVHEREHIRHAEQLRERGTTRQQVLRGEATSYDWVRPGMTALPSDLAAAYLWAQLQQLESTLARLRGHVERYRRGFAELAREGRIELPPVAENRTDNASIFYLMTPDQESRDLIVQGLHDKGIIAGQHYTPLHLEPMGRDLGGAPGQMPVAEGASGRLLRLPLFVDLTPSQQELVIAEVRHCLERL
ncbi:MAG: aminotransferase class I/II-fold pyridoxal phosphate-dependent enzyme [Thermoanaerobaculia bacterium]|nr:aminotransferase class I/II-fold pyridoxal phosphate-dependent enzyme [Thermoanaerobaculia bacterium]